MVESNSLCLDDLTSVGHVHVYYFIIAELVLEVNLETKKELLLLVSTTWKVVNWAAQTKASFQDLL